MPGKFNYELRYQYPHLIGEDTEVWERFVSKFPKKFDSVDYDIKVGLGADTSPIPDESDKKYWATLTKKRIDVIGFKNDFVTIVEVKKRATLFTLGQILGYRFLYLKEHPELHVVKTLIVCDTISQDDIDVLNHYGIDFIIV
ncbi:MAG: hypothetical protein HWN66_22445 [Candidatus Helarchaeota archaeon]|nr:hypothetical protein [Candidatus Helarchaeota archaeon]